MARKTEPGRIAPPDAIAHPLNPDNSPPATAESAFRLAHILLEAILVAVEDASYTKDDVRRDLTVLSQRLKDAAQDARTGPGRP